MTLDADHPLSAATAQTGANCESASSINTRSACSVRRPASSSPLNWWTTSLASPTGQSCGSTGATFARCARTATTDARRGIRHSTAGRRVGLHGCAPRPSPFTSSAARPPPARLPTSGRGQHPSTLSSTSTPSRPTCPAYVPNRVNGVPAPYNIPATGLDNAAGLKIYLSYFQGSGDSDDVTSKTFA